MFNNLRQKLHSYLPYIKDKFDTHKKHLLLALFAAYQFNLFALPIQLLLLLTEQFVLTSFILVKFGLIFGIAFAILGSVAYQTYFKKSKYLPKFSLNLMSSKPPAVEKKLRPTGVVPGVHNFFEHDLHKPKERKSDFTRSAAMLPTLPTEQPLPNSQPKPKSYVNFLRPIFLMTCFGFFPHNLLTYVLYPFFKIYFFYELLNHYEEIRVWAQNQYDLFNSVIENYLNSFALDKVFPWLLQFTQSHYLHMINVGITLLLIHNMPLFWASLTVYGLYMHRDWPQYQYHQHFQRIFLSGADILIRKTARLNSYQRLALMTGVTFMLAFSLQLLGTGLLLQTGIIGLQILMPILGIRALIQQIFFKNPTKFINTHFGKILGAWWGYQNAFYYIKGHVMGNLGPAYGYVTNLAFAGGFLQSFLAPFGQFYLGSTIENLFNYSMVVGGNFAGQLGPSFFQVCTFIFLGMAVGLALEYLAENVFTTSTVEIDKVENFSEKMIKIINPGGMRQQFSFALIGLLTPILLLSPTGALFLSITAGNIELALGLIIALQIALFIPLNSFIDWYKAKSKAVANGNKNSIGADEPSHLSEVTQTSSAELEKLQSLILQKPQEKNVVEACLAPNPATIVQVPEPKQNFEFPSDPPARPFGALKKI